MRQEQFETAHQALWQDLAALLDRLEQQDKKAIGEAASKLADFPRDYRRLCSQFALARSRGFSPDLQNQLHHLVLRGHAQLYRYRTHWGWRLVYFVLAEFPWTLRRRRGYFWAALALFCLPMILTGLACYHDQEIIYTILDQQQVAELEGMYDPVNQHHGRAVERASETDLTMFGFYIMNNIGIGFRTFAGGILAGLGSLFYLVFNGIILGGVAGHLTRLGYTETFWSFVSGHGAFELTAIVICGAAGLLLGHAVVAPGQRPRLRALRENALEAVKLVMGAALMLLAAAFIEAFWSSSGAAVWVKYTLAGLFWAVVVLYLTRVGDGSH